MTVSNTTYRVAYNGDDSTTAFPVTFVFQENDDLQAVLTDGDGVETTWTEGVEYSLTGGSGSTGTLTATTAPASGETLTITRALDLTQETDYPEGGKFPAASHELALDKAIQVAQQLQEQIDRCIKMSVGDGQAGNGLTLAAVSTRASKLLGFTSAGALDYIAADDASSDGVTASGSTTERSLAERFAEVFNVKDYGAAGDGTTDDTTAVQAAITAAAAATYDGVVFFPAGIYLCDQLNMASGVELRGVSRTSATIKWSGTGTNGVIWATSDNNVTIRRLTIDGDSQTFSTSNRGLITVFTSSTGTMLVEDCVIKNSAYHGIMQWTAPLVVRGCEIHDCAYYGIYGYGSISTLRRSLHVESCVIHDIDRNGVQVGDHGAGSTYDAAVFISNNYFYNIDDAAASSGQTGNAILIYRASNAQLIGNHCRKCYSTGIRVNDADNVVIIGGKYEDIGEVGIFIEFVANYCHVIGANVYQARNAGIFLTNVSSAMSGLVEGCIVKDVGVTGYGYGDSTTATPVSTGYGIYVEYGRVIGNYVEDIDGNTQGIGIGCGVANAALNIRCSNNEVRDCDYGIGFANGGTSKSGPIHIDHNDMYTIGTAYFTAISGAGKDPTAITDANMLDVFLMENYPSAVEWQTIADADATPSVAGLKRLITANTGATTITDFDQACDGQEIILVAGDANTTLDFTSSALKGNGGSDKTLAAGDVVKAIYHATNAEWYCTIGDA